MENKIADPIQDSAFFIENITLLISNRTENEKRARGSEKTLPIISNDLFFLPLAQLDILRTHSFFLQKYRNLNF